MQIMGSAEKLARVIGNVALGAETNTTMPSLCSIYFRRRETGEIELASTDRYRLVVATIGSDLGKGDGQYLVNAKSFVSSLSLAVKSSAKNSLITIDLAESVIKFGESTIAFETLPYKFPDYDSTMPSVTDQLPSGVFTVVSESLALLGKIKFDKRDTSAWTIRFNGDTKPALAERNDSDITYRVWVMPKLVR